MAKDKEFESRMQGMIYSYNLVKEGGLDALEKDIRRRNILKAPMKFTSAQIENFWHELSANLYNNMLTTVCYTLHDNYGFGAKRIKDFKAAYDKNVEATLDLDYVGEHYVRLQDYAVELNEKFQLGIDLTRVAVSQDAFDESDLRYHTCRMERIVEELRQNGYGDAAEFLQAKLD